MSAVFRQENRELTKRHGVHQMSSLVQDNLNRYTFVSPPVRGSLCIAPTVQRAYLDRVVSLGDVLLARIGGPKGVHLAHQTGVCVPGHFQGVM
jgi:hypothetical protein